MKKSVFSKITYADDDLDPDMALCKNLRDQVGAFYFQKKITFKTKAFGFNFQF